MRRIGSTDIASIVALYRPGMEHLAKKKTAADTWMRLVHGIEVPRSPVMSRGLRVEPLLRDLYRETIGPVSGATGVIQHPAHKWMTGSPDAFAGDVLVELKTCSKWIQNRWGSPGSDELPPDYQLQVMHLLEVSGRRKAHILCAFGTDMKDEFGSPDFAIESTAIYQADWDPQIIATIIECGERFWSEHVLTRVPPGVAPLHNKRHFKRLENERRDKAERNPEAERGVGEGAVGDDGR